MPTRISGPEVPLKPVKWAMKEEKTMFHLDEERETQEMENSSNMYIIFGVYLRNRAKKVKGSENEDVFSINCRGEGAKSSAK